jgi:hypothetical protein
MYPFQLCLLRMVQAAVVDAVFCYVCIWNVVYLVCGPICSNIYILLLMYCFIVSFMRAIFVTYLIYFCINPYVIFLCFIYSV